MFNKSFFIVLSAALFAGVSVAVPSPKSAGRCSTGSLQCCGQVQNTEGGILGIPIPIGLSCSSVDTLGILGDGTSCTSTPVCCESVQGDTGINCSPTNVPLGV